LRESVARPVLETVERKVASRSGLLSGWQADAHLHTDPRLAKAGSGEQRAHVSPIPNATLWPCMPVGEQVAGRSLGTIFYPARPTARIACGQLWHLIPRSLPGRGLFRHSRNGFAADVVPPGEALLARFEAGEVAAASLAAARRSAQPQQEPGPTRGVIVPGRPFGQFLTVAAWAPRISPRPIRPHAGFPAATAAPAAEARNAGQVLHVLEKSLGM
jgi:hypothetical protein